MQNGMFFIGYIAGSLCSEGTFREVREETKVFWEKPQCNSPHSSLST